jgi:hypothetical protein
MDSNSQSGSSFGSVGYIPSHSPITPKSMKCDSRAYTFVSLCLGHEPKAKVATSTLKD